MLKTQPRQVLGYLPLAFALPAANICHGEMTIVKRQWVHKLTFAIETSKAISMALQNMATLVTYRFLDI
jgi:hypothetical protein